MKKYLLGATFVGVALAGCVNEEVVDNIQQERQKITFDSPVMYSNSDSRAKVNSEMPTIYDEAEEFVVYGVKHAGSFAGWANGTTFMNGVTVKYDSRLGGWAPDEPYYWPGGNEMVTFAAYSPADLTPYKNSTEQEDEAPETKVEYGSSGLKITDFKVAKDVSKQFDLMFSKRAYDKTFNEGNGGYAGVPIVFQHALSSIKFMFVTESTSSEIVRLRSIDLLNIYSQADFYEDIDEDETDYDRYERTRDVANGNVDPVWTLDSYEMPTDFNIYTGNATFPKAPTYVTHPAALLLPQTLSTTGSNTPKLKVTYIVGQNTEIKEKEIPLAGMYASETNSVVDGQNAGTLITHWEMGNRYIYVLHYGNSEILFAPSVEEWKDVKYIIVNLNDAATADE